MGIRRQYAAVNRRGQSSNKKPPRAGTCGAFLAAWALALSLAGCAPSDSTKTTEQTATVTPEAGGTVASADGKATLKFPPNAVTTEQTITITPIDAADLGPEFDGLDVSFAYEMGPSGLQFAEPVEVSVTVDGTPSVDAGTISVDSLQLLLTSDGSQALALGDPTVVVDADAGSITLNGTLAHFSPLVITQVYGSDAASASTSVSVTGVPDQLELNVSARVTAELAPRVLEYSTAEYGDRASVKFEPTEDSALRQVPFVTMRPDPTTPGSTGFYSANDYTCHAAGTGEYDAVISATTSPNQLEQWFAALADKRVSWIVRKSVTCVDPNTDGEPAATALTEAPPATRETVGEGVENRTGAPLAGTLVELDQNADGGVTNPDLNFKVAIAIDLENDQNKPWNEPASDSTPNRLLRLHDVGGDSANNVPTFAVENDQFNTRFVFYDSPFAPQGGPPAVLYERQSVYQDFGFGSTAAYIEVVNEAPTTVGFVLRGRRSPGKYGALNEGYQIVLGPGSTFRTWDRYYNDRLWFENVSQTDGGEPFDDPPIDGGSHQFLAPGDWRGARITITEAPAGEGQGAPVPLEFTKDEVVEFIATF